MPIAKPVTGPDLNASTTNRLPPSPGGPAQGSRGATTSAAALAAEWGTGGRYVRSDTRRAASALVSVSTSCSQATEGFMHLSRLVGTEGGVLY